VPPVDLYDAAHPDGPRAPPGVGRFHPDRWTLSPDQSMLSAGLHTQGADEGVEETQDHGLGIMTRRAQLDLRGADTIAGSTTPQAHRPF
jgi:hypothetical protein